MRWGIAWLAAGLLLIVGLLTPLLAGADDRDNWKISNNWRQPLFTAAAQNPLEAQMMGEKPFQANPDKSLFPGMTPGINLEDDGAIIRLPHNLELRISFLYNSEPSPVESKRQVKSPLLMKYSMDYRLLPNLQVGLSGYLYRPNAEEGFPFPRSVGDRVLGVGPGVRYDLGRWSFVVRSQLETGSRDRGESLENWFRVWYAF